MSTLVSITGVLNWKTGQSMTQAHNNYSTVDTVGISVFVFTHDYADSVWTVRRNWNCNNYHNLQVQ